jgi:hypothetical protein
MGLSAHDPFWTFVPPQLSLSPTGSSQLVCGLQRWLGVAACLFDRRESNCGLCPFCRPRRLPRAFAAAMPERIRSWINSRSKSAIPAMIVAIMRPCGVVRSKARPLSVQF